MESIISWHVELYVDKDDLIAFRKLTRAMVATARMERGVLAYERFECEDAGNIHLYERYIDSEAAIAHLNAFHDRYGHAFGDLVMRVRFEVFGYPSLELKKHLDPLGARYFAPMG